MVASLSSMHHAPRRSVNPIRRLQWQRPHRDDIMTILAPIRTLFTPEEYIELERHAEHKNEYVDGEIVAMSGGAKRHSRIKVALVRLIDSQLAGGPCDAFDGDLRVHVDPMLYTYPDLSVVCGDSEVESAGDDDTLLNPTVIFEVLSPSTEAYDRGEKFRRYQRMPSLRQYVLVSQDRPRIEVFTRQGDFWTYRDASGLVASVRLDAIDCTLALREVYAKLRFDTDEDPPATAGDNVR